MSVTRELLALWCIMFVGAGFTSLSRIHVHPDNHWLLDRSGRVRIFHGINAVQKGFPWYPAPVLNQSRLDELQSWGFNAIRLGMMWAGAEPQEGRYNHTYMSTMRNITAELGRRGIYTILDMHQDGLDSLYDGVPPWLVASFPPPEHPYPWPLKNITSWDQAYLTQQCSHNFQCLYDNYKGAADKMARFWKFVATEFRTQTSVLGYELLNEPWVGDWTADPELFLPGHAGKTNVSPLHDRVTRSVRTADDETLVFYEPVTWGYIFAEDGALGSGFAHVPGGSAYRNRSVLSYHYYCWLFQEGQPYPPYKKIFCNEILGPKLFSAVQEDLKTLGGGSFLTEFGLCRPNASDPSFSDTVECRFVLEKVDSLLQSWTYWDASPGSSVLWDATGRAIPERVSMFARPYTRAVAGVPTAMTFDLNTRHFELTFASNPAIEDPTEIFVPRLHYAEGYTVMSSAELECEVDKKDHSLLYVRPKQTNEVRTFPTDASTVSVVPSSHANSVSGNICLKVNW
ncbi:endoglycoceramidase-like [Branchiostoma floridae x Branchiostoma belcheri]